MKGKLKDCDVMVYGKNFVSGIIASVNGWDLNYEFRHL